MAPIYQEVVLSWKGKDYTIHPDFRMVQDIEALGISISGVIGGMSRGEPQISQVSTIVSFMLNSGGAKNCTPKLVYDWAASFKRIDYEKIQIAIIMGFIPMEPEPYSGNSGGPVDGAETKAEMEASEMKPESSPT